MSQSDYKNEIEQFEKRIFDLQQLLEISKSLNSTLDFHNLIDSILFTTMAQMRVQKAGIFVWKNLDCADLYLHRGFQGFELEKNQEYTLAYDHPLTRLLITENRSLNLHEIEDGLENKDGIRFFWEMEPDLLVPMINKGQLNGIIVVGDRINGEGFNEYERDYILNIAVFGAIATHNAYLFELSTTDMMTKLRLRHFFIAALRQSMEEVSINKNRKLSFVILDIDHFKNLNDTYGHTCGDVVLKRIAQVIQENVRQVDITARYGGEEFAVLLPDTDIEGASEIAERIRSAIDNTRILWMEEELSVTISIGVAEYKPIKDHDYLSLIERADKALYISKEHGRNQVTLAN